MFSFKNIQEYHQQLAANATTCVDVVKHYLQQIEKSNDSVAMYLADLYTVFSNLVGIPAICIPLFKHSNGMPFGLQIMAAHNEETEMLRMAKAIENF